MCVVCVCALVFVLCVCALVFVLCVCVLVFVLCVLCMRVCVCMHAHMRLVYHPAPTININIVI